MIKKAQAGWIALIVVVVIVFLIFSFFGSIIGSYLGLVKDTVSADNYKKNYQWFKDEESAITQLKSQVCASQSQIKDFKSTYGNDTSKWSTAATQQYGDLTFAQNGYVSKYNSLVSDYNAHRSDWIRDFGKGDAPKEYAEFMAGDC